MPSPPISSTLEITARNHRNPIVSRAGFDLTHPYIEQCWAPVAGPSAVLLLRRLPVLWHEREPAVIPVDELARSLGLGASLGARSRFNRTVERVVHAGLAKWAEPGRVLGVYVKVPPLSPRQVERLPEWSRQAHERLLSAHLEALARQDVNVRLGTASQADSSGRPNSPDPPVPQVTARLDRLQRRAGTVVPVIGR